MQTSRLQLFQKWMFEREDIMAKKTAVARALKANGYGRVANLETFNLKPFAMHLKIDIGWIEAGVVYAHQCGRCTG